MSDAYQVRFNYTQGGEFLLNGEQYIGFFNVFSDGSVMTDRYRSYKSKVLTSLGNYTAGYYKTDFHKDLLVYDTHELPYSRSDVTIEFNELVNFTTINTKIGYLHENLMYVYSRMFCGDTDVPYTYDKTACISNVTNSFNWYNTPNYTSYGHSTFTSNTALSTYAEVDNIKRFTIIPFENNTGFGIIGITDTHIIGLTSNIDFTNISVPLLYSNVIDNYSEEQCQSLQDLTFDGRYLYVTDSHINSGGQVFKYDITSYFTGDPAFENNRFLIKPVGGLGTKIDGNKFKGCGIIGSKPGAIMVSDQGNNAVKIFDRDLVWIKTIPLPKGPYVALDIKYRKLNDHFYMLVRNTQTNEHMLYEFSSDYRLISRTTFEDELYAETDGAFKRMVFSEQDSNVFYLITNSTVYKKFFSKPKKTFATFNRNKFGQSPFFVWRLESVAWDRNTRKWNDSLLHPPIQLMDIDMLPSSTGVDSLFVFGSSAFFHFSEITNYNSALKSYKMPFYDLSSIRLEYNENIQALTLNKEFAKVYSNIIQLKNALKGRFNFEYDSYGDLKYKNYVYFLDEEVNSLNVEIDNNTRANDNEIIQSGVINKLFTKVYDIQLAMLKLTYPKIFNFRSIATNQNVLMID